MQLHLLHLDLEQQLMHAHTLEEEIVDLEDDDEVDRVAEVGDFRFGSI